ncbi:aldo/keto reductase [uncultured Alsobacter sp.]|uniref:aldo/keto reductase n=1 Tax=uncultured Alsobacter sp. TaxID=1748258 RepID=UPI0025F798D6|nr:aldo/keto reductase [uncultured Alsobacter sp.]
MDGPALSRIVRGGWQVHAGTSADPAAEARRILAFMAAGVSTFETSDTYRHVDDALRLAIAARREAGLPPPRVHGRLTLPCDVEDGCRQVLDRLGAGRIDLLQIQDWALREDRILAACRAVSDLQARGFVGGLGVMNMSEETLQVLWDAGVRPASVQVQLSLLDRRPLTALTGWAGRHGVAVLAYGTLAGGLLDGRWLGRPDPGLRSTGDAPFHAEYRAIVEAFGGWALYQELLAALASIASACSATIPDLALRWVLDRPGVAAALVGASDPARVAAWRRALALRWPDDAEARIDAVLARSPGVPGPVGWLERQADGPFAKAIAASRSAASHIP